MANSGQPSGFFEENAGDMDLSGQPAGLFGGNVGEMDLWSYLNTGTGYDPTSEMSFRLGNLEWPRNQITGTQFNNKQCGEHQPARVSHGISFPKAPSSDQTNINFQGSGTFDSRPHGQAAGISVCVPQSSDQTNINIVQTTRTPRMTPEQQAARKKEIDRIYREKKKQKDKEVQSELKKLKDENKKLKEINETLQSKAEMMDQLKITCDELKSQYEKQYALVQSLSLQLLQKDEDLKKLIKEGYKHNKKPTQYPSPSDEERHSEKEISAVKLDRGDSEDENDSKKKKKRVARSASRERHSGKVPEFADINELMEMRQVSLAAKREWYEAGAERYGSASNPTTKVDSYSITECLHILKSMGDLPYSIVKKATAKFKSSADERETFVGLTEDWRRDWVKDLDNVA